MTADIKPVAWRVANSPHGPFDFRKTEPNGWSHSEPLYPQQAIDALRAERDAAIRGEHRTDDTQPTWAELVTYWRGRAQRAEAQVAELREAGARVTAAFRAHGEATPWTRESDRTRHECEAAMLALDAALARAGKAPHPAAQEGGHE